MYDANSPVCLFTVRKKIYVLHCLPQDNIQPFTMRLQGTIDAAVNGGIAKYQNAFFGPDYLMVYPENADHVNRLKVLLSDQVS